MFHIEMSFQSFDASFQLVQVTYVTSDIHSSIKSFPNLFSFQDA